MNFISGFDRRRKFTKSSENPRVRRVIDDNRIGWNGMGWDVRMHIQRGVWGT